MLGRVAALYDIHGNLPALEAALAAADEAGVELIVVGGDVVPGPMPVETLERLLALGERARFLRGNTDRWTVAAYDGAELSALPAPAREPIAWCAGQLERRHRDLLAALPPTLVLEIAGVGEVLFCHATPGSDEEIVTVATPEARVRSLLAGVTEALVVCGHTHMPFDRTVGGVRLVNAGSVGMPFGEAGAHWLLLDGGVRPMRSSYDLDAAAARVRATAYPGAAEFAARSILSPPSKSEMLRAFEPAAAPRAPS